MDQMQTSNGNRQTRLETAEGLKIYEQLCSTGSTQREVANKLGVPRGTLRHWQSRKESIPLPDIVVDCFESPDGAAFLHRLVTSIQFVMTEVAACGIRQVNLVLRLSQLNHFLSSSYEGMRQRGLIMQEKIVEFGVNESKRLSEGMPPKKITIAQDETFHPKACLVSIDVLSNYILLEQYSASRDASSWNEAMKKALESLPVEVVQSTSDEAKGILAHVEQCFGAQHSPDIFHVQYEISKGTSASLSAKVRQAIKALERANKNIDEWTRLQKSPPSGKGRPPEIMHKSLSELEEVREDAKKNLKVAQERQEIILTAKRSIGYLYHPYDLKTGKPKDPEVLAEELNEAFDKIQAAAEASSLKEAAFQKIQKARRVLPKLLNTLEFFWGLVSALIDSLSLSEKMEWTLRNILIPAEYLQMASRKAKAAEARKSIEAVVSNLLGRLDELPEWTVLDEEDRSCLYRVACECAGYFQRSSSCVEGRNGQLSLRHHSFHHLSDQKLKSLTVIHNYFITRGDRTTAAERFFGKKPADLFEHLIEKMPYPGRSGVRGKLLNAAS